LQIRQAAGDGGASALEAACRMPYDKLVLFNCLDNAVNSAVYEHQKKELEKLKAQNK
jgi:hypothetical protein